MYLRKKAKGLQHEVPSYQHRLFRSLSLLGIGDHNYDFCLCIYWFILILASMLSDASLFYTKWDSFFLSQSGRTSDQRWDIDSYMYHRSQTSKQTTGFVKQWNRWRLPSIYILKGIRFRKGIYPRFDPLIQLFGKREIFNRSFSILTNLLI